MKPRRWFVTPELTQWRHMVACGDYAGPFATWPHHPSGIDPDALFREMLVLVDAKPTMWGIPVEWEDVHRVTSRKYPRVDWVGEPPYTQGSQGYIWDLRLPDEL